MFVRGMCISTLLSFQNQCHVNTFMLGTGHKVQGGGGPAKSVSVETVFC